ncbi:biotin carboxylase N-terminal domain-containing protein [Microbacterium sp. NPDC076911]|uniref:acetyl/propionyl/methylcrotonyl-CoA carboxylase subunit alpha n=1 Tax=Microbacterium sp. NPDC076911 TaxID=3154958 RepID=UPI003412B414
MTSFDTVLVANRGEIARRVIRTLRALNIRSVAVYSDADANAPHVREADVAVRIGTAAASESYLNIDAVLHAARASGAQAIHPGYGFLSENVAFARACAESDIVFIGPTEHALEVMGDKIRSKEQVSAYGVPTVPGFSAAGLSDEAIARKADETGYPLLVKPSAGGGGKGMQVVRHASELTEALAAARRVAAAAFGDDTLLFERLIERPRHIEVQVLADEHGNVIHLGERECTLQRRHQKVIEESPSIAVDAATRERLGAAACAAAASVGYVGAGTVEFLVAAQHPEDFFFIEMNTRLQVEHPVTEAVTGIDLVEQQVRVAAGRALEIAQQDVALTGHAIEARVYAESPERGFLPATGEVLMWRAADGVRTDSAVETGSEVTADYDPMIAKVVAFGASRVEALALLDEALAETVLLGVDSNIGFLRALIAHPDVVSGEMDTGLIDRMPPFEEPALGLAPLTAVAVGGAAKSNIHDNPNAASELWRSSSGWRGSASAVLRTAAFEMADGTLTTVSLPVAAHTTGDHIAVAVDRDGWSWVHAHGETRRLRALTRREASAQQRSRRARAGAATNPDLRAPMPGAIVAVHVADGDQVVAGERVLTIEAMKMEHPIVAEHDGVVHVIGAVGEQVRRDQILARVDETSAIDSHRTNPTEAAAHEAAAAES